MLLGWLDAAVERACRDRTVGCGLWGRMGWDQLQELLALTSVATPLERLTRIPPVTLTVDRSGAAPSLAIRYRTIAMIADPYSPRGPLPVPQEDCDMHTLDTSDRLAVHDIRCDDASPRAGDRA